MAETFGVKLKSKDAPKEGSQQRPGCKRSDFKTKPVSDLKAMFDKSDGQNCSKAFSEVDINVNKTTKAVTVTTQQSNQGKIGQKTIKTENAHKKVKQTNSNKVQMSEEDERDFEALAIKLKKTGVDLDALEGKSQSKVAVAKTYSRGKTYQATVESKINKVSDNGDPEVDRNNAASIISFGLTKLRTRPGSLKKHDGGRSRGSSFDEENSSGDKTPSSPKSMSPRSNSPVSKETKIIPGVPTGWKGKTEDSKTKVKGIPNFSESSVGKIRSETSNDVSRTNIAGFRSVSPVFQRKNSSDDLSTNSSPNNLSPKGYKPLNNKTEKSTSAIKTYENKNIRKDGSSNVLKQTAVSKGKKEGEKEVISEKKKIFEQKSDPNKLDTSNKKVDITKNKDRGDFKWLDKGRISLQEFKQKQDNKFSGHRPLSRASSSGSNSSLSRKDAPGLGNKAWRFDSTEPQSDSSQSSKDFPDRRREFTASRKMSAEKFLDIKQNFETKVVKTKSQSPSGEPRKKIEIKPNKKILERKQSFEGGEIFKKKVYEKSEVISPRDKGNVLAAIKSLNELDAKAKAQPAIVRRTRSLPSDSLDDDNDSSVDFYEDIESHHGPSYQDILGIKMGDDVSNEGDVSSEADLLYEEIPANLAHQNKGRLLFFTTDNSLFSLSSPWQNMFIVLFCL